MLAALVLVAGASAAGQVGADGPSGTIAFASLAPRGWDLYVTEVNTRWTRRLTADPALDFNAAFAPDGGRIAFVSRRDGDAELYTVDLDGSAPRRLTRTFALDDHPAWSPDGRHIALSSTREPSDRPGRAWNAIYVMDADGSGARRISPADAADYSPAWSPRGDLIACASGSGEAGRADLYVMAPDGSGRRRVVADGGWPAFAADGRALFFHRKAGGRWGVWRVGLDGSGAERVTPEGLDAFTPSASADGRHLAVAVLRGDHRQIEVLDLETRTLAPVTADATDHWNPSLAPDGRTVAYHQSSPDAGTPNIEPWGAPPGTDLRLLRVAGSFPAFAPDGRRLALAGGGFGRLDVMGVDGSGRRTIREGKSRGVFSVSWAHRGDRIAFSEGGTFQGPRAQVEVVTIAPDGSDIRPLTDDPANDAFPSFSPDGRRLVFRSGRGGSKNLYIMDADGTHPRRLTEGDWTDTMCDWSPTGEWIAFASDRGGDFEVWLIRPDGSDLHKLVGGGGRNNHPHFAPDGRWVVFTSKRAGFSAEEISLPDQPQPYGDLFAVRLDGSGLLRLTHNGFEEGTPAWGPAVEVRPSSEGPGREAEDY